MDSISEFYSPLAESYDQMLSFDHRLDSARRFVAALRERIGGFSTAVDFACGTGVYAMALAEQAERVFGSDLSSAMIEQARANGAQLGLEIEWLVKPMQEPLAEEPLDLALCMGNSLPHLLEEDDLKQALQNFFATLKSGGTLILHLLNYCRILQRRERIIGVTRDTEGREFIRFYDFSEKSKIVFNLLTIDWRGNSSGQEPATSLRGVELYPYTEEELKSALAATGFSGIQSYGDLNFSPFEADSSGTLLLLAKR